MRISKLTPYILYVITFSLFFASSNTLSDALLMARTTTGTAYTAPIFNFSYLASQIGLCAVWTMPYVICQVAAAALTVKALSLRKLFCLSCVFTVLCHLLCALAFRMFERAVLVFVVGSEGMETPASHLSRWGEYRLELCRGVYVWHEIQ